MEMTSWKDQVPGAQQPWRVALRYGRYHFTVLEGLHNRKLSASIVTGKTLYAYTRDDKFSPSRSLVECARPR
jgi:hypothetical protein